MATDEYTLEDQAAGRCRYCKCSAEYTCYCESIAEIARKEGALAEREKVLKLIRELQDTTIKGLRSEFNSARVNAFVELEKVLKEQGIKIK